MKTIAYTGPSDFQEFGKADFAKAGVEANKHRFAQGEPTEVEDEVADALTSKEGIFADFSFTDLTPVDEEDQEAEAEKAAKKSTKKAAAKSDEGGAETSGEGAVAQSAGDTPTASGPTSTGAGSSTSGATS